MVTRRARLSLITWCIAVHCIKKGRASATFPVYRTHPSNIGQPPVFAFDGTTVHCLHFDIIGKCLF